MNIIELMPDINLWTLNAWGPVDSGIYGVLSDDAQIPSVTATSPAFAVPANAVKTLKGSFGGYGWGTGIAGNQNITLRVSYYTGSGGSGTLISTSQVVATTQSTPSTSVTVPSTAVSAIATFFNSGGARLSTGSVMLVSQLSLR